MREDTDATVWTPEQAKAWAAPRSGYTAVLPMGMSGEVLVAYLLPERAPELRQ